jgi:hypothetical protein
MRRRGADAQGVGSMKAGRMITRLMTSESTSKEPVIRICYQPTPSDSPLITALWRWEGKSLIRTIDRNPSDSGFHPSRSDRWHLPKSLRSSHPWGMLLLWVCRRHSCKS